MSTVIPPLARRNSGLAGSASHCQHETSAMSPSAPERIRCPDQLGHEASQYPICSSTVATRVAAAATRRWSYRRASRTGSGAAWVRTRCDQVAVQAGRRCDQHRLDVTGRDGLGEIGVGAHARAERLGAR
jgi:hypothetical protein